MVSEESKRIRFTSHAHQKFEFLRRYGFEVSEGAVKEAVLSPGRVDRRGEQLLALKSIGREYAIGVLCKIVNDNIVLLTFYSVKRERFNV